MAKHTKTSSKRKVVSLADYSIPLDKPKNKVEKLVYKLDPDIFFCSKCKQWFNIKFIGIAFTKEYCVCHKCGGSGLENFAMPLVRVVNPTLIAKELFTVQPMDGPVGLTFGLKVKYKKGRK